MVIRRSSLLTATSVIVLSLVGASGLQEPTTPPSSDTEVRSPGAGLKKELAIEVCGPKGERAYLDRLRCPDGSRVRYERTGSFGFRNDPLTPEDGKAVEEQMGHDEPIKSGQKDFHTIDGYDVRCSGKSEIVYLDMYHCPQPKKPPVPPGYTFAK